MNTLKAHDPDGWDKLLALAIFIACLGFAWYVYGDKEWDALGLGAWLGIAGFSSLHRIFAGYWPWRAWDGEPTSVVHYENLDEDGNVTSITTVITKDRTED